MSRRWTTLTLLPIAFAALAPAEALAETTGIAPVPVAEAPVAVSEAEPLPTAPPPDAAEAPFRPRLFFGATGGIGFAAVKHPELATPRVYGGLLAMNIGYACSPRWSIGLEFTNMEKVVSRDSGGERFASATQWLKTQAECASCTGRGPAGGPVLAFNMLLSSFGARIDVTPFGRDGLYLGGSGGLAVVTLLDPRFGGAGSAHAGLRYTAWDLLTFGIEGGVQGQAFQGGTAAIAYGGAMVRLAMVEPPKKAPSKPGPILPLPTQR